MRRILLLLSIPGLLLAQASSHRLTLDDLVSAEPIGETELSPDGKTFSLTHNEPNMLKAA